MSVLITNARVLTLASGDRPRRGDTLGVLAPIDRANVHVADGRIQSVEELEKASGTGQLASGKSAERIIDAAGRVLLPGFVDCHTHACWAGDRLDEWEMKKQGATYLELLEAGGGIMSTVRAVRAASEAELAESLLARLERMLAQGTTAVEIKSGYGLDTETELKMLGAIDAAAKQWPGHVLMTACIGHALDPAIRHESFVARTIGETLDAVHAAFPAVTIDAYCEKGAWSLDDCLGLFERARELGHPCRVHADQFNALGMTPASIRLGLRSVDHLEASRPAELRALAESGLYGVMLPCSGFHLSEAGKKAIGTRHQASGKREERGATEPPAQAGGLLRTGETGNDYADGRSFVDAGGALAIATNYNPGSAPCGSMPMTIALAVRTLGLTSAEAIAAATVNSASLLGLSNRGTIVPGAVADLVLLAHTDERMLGYEFGGDPVDHVIVGGVVVR